MNEKFVSETAKTWFDKLLLGLILLVFFCFGLTFGMMFAQQNYERDAFLKIEQINEANAKQAEEERKQLQKAQKEIMKELDQVKDLVKK